MSELRTLRFTNGDHYIGETLADLRHGRGKHFCSNGDTHDGHWYKGMRHGHGVALFARGFEYEGDFQYDHAEGFGKAKYENGALYEGDFLRDQRSGWGVQIFSDEAVYVGEWASDNIDGNGRLTQKDGSVHEGCWKEGSQTSGMWVSSDKQQEYTGDFEGGKKHGKGILVTKGFMRYQGEFREDLQHGQGKCRWSDGSSYDGEWEKGRRHGQGKLVGADGYKYDGGWIDDQEHGFGNVRLADGSRYSGNFQKGKCDGEGRMRSAAGDRYEGSWVAGKQDGQGRCLFANGDKYQGEWREGKRHGQGRCQFAEGQFFQGWWESDHWLQSEAEPSHCKLRGSGLVSALAGQQATFQILANDELRNKRLVGGDSFCGWMEGPTTVHADITDNEDGSYTATYCTATSGVYQLYVTNGTGEAVADSPYPLIILPGPPAVRKSTVKVNRLGDLKAGKTVEFKIQARDLHGNKCTAAELPEELPVECELSCGNSITKVTVKVGPKGSYHCNCLPLQAGYYRLAVTSGGITLAGTPLSLKICGAGEGTENFSVDQKLVDKVIEWELKAAEQYAADGDADGWNSDASQPETAEQRYIREHPEVPVVEDLGDMWKVGKLQNERKALRERQLAMEEMQIKKSEPAQE